MNRTDAALVEECLNGDRGAFACLVDRHQQAVFSLAMSMTGQNYADACDFAQEAFIVAYKKLHYFNPEYAFKNWLLTICANLTKNRFRRRARRWRAEQNFVELSAAGGPSDRHRRDEVTEVLGRLPEKIRVPLTLRHIEGLSYEEIAAILSIGVSAAKMRVKRGLDELAAKLGEP
jgi:RNA polymerase sigma-70 factor (ECF subfamily)